VRSEGKVSTVSLAIAATCAVLVPLTLHAQAVATAPALRLASRATGVARTVVYTGQFITLDSLQPRADAIAVRDGRLVAVGSVAQVEAQVGTGVRHVALRGTVVPGLADAHVHVASLGETLESLDLRALSKEAILARVREAARRAPAGAWIQGGGWDQSFWGGDFPTATELDAASAGHPVLLTRIDGHATWANSRALQLSGITAATRDPAGGRIVRGEGGVPAGVLIDDAIELVTKAVPPLTMRARVARLQRALAQYARWGLTEVHDAGVDRPTLAAYRRLARAGALPVRVYAMAAADAATLDDVLPRGPVVGDAQGTFTLRCVKIVDDGALGSRGARLAAPYSDDASQRGFDMAPGDSLDRLVARARTHGFQVAVHAIGDAATTDVLDAFARVGTPATVRDARFRLEHASMIADRDLPRLAALGVVASMQPVFAGEYSRFAEARVGGARLSTVLRTRDVLSSGAVMAAGTDFPASDTGDPIATLDALVTRRGADGTPVDGWIPDQGVEVGVALRAMTIAPAFAAFEEGEGGIIAVGRRADLTVLSGDPLASPNDARRRLTVLQTIVGGRTVYRAR